MINTIGPNTTIWRDGQDLLRVKQNDFDPVFFECRSTGGVGSDVLDNWFMLMRRAMRESEGIGIALPQVGVNGRLVYIEWGGVTMTLVNLRVEALDEPDGDIPEHIEDVEGCLSIPGRTFLVGRPTFITATWQDLDGTLRGEEIFGGYLARILQHEHDHLEGLLIDRFPEVEISGKEVAIT